MLPRSHPFLQIRKSPIHGKGAFAVRNIAKGTEIIEYRGECMTQGDADARYGGDSIDHTKTFLFDVNGSTVIDATYRYNNARYINHSCDPNCEAVYENSRVFIVAIRKILCREELVYDYHLELEGVYPVRWRKLYACRCGAKSCRGSLLKYRRSR